MAAVKGSVPANSSVFDNKRINQSVLAPFCDCSSEARQSEKPVTFLYLKIEKKNNYCQVLWCFSQRGEKEEQEELEEAM